MTTRPSAQTWNSQRRKQDSRVCVAVTRKTRVPFLLVSSVGTRTFTFPTLHEAKVKAPRPDVFLSGGRLLVDPGMVSAETAAENRGLGGDFHGSGARRRR